MTQGETGLARRIGCLGNRQGVTAENSGTVRCSLSANMGSSLTRMCICMLS